MTATALEVWGDPISHSLSPALHRAAYAQLGWEWTYERRRVTESAFLSELASLGPHHRGLSCTMPLKAAAFQAASSHDSRSALTRASNTLLLTDGRVRAFNTDVGGIVAALAESGITHLGSARIVGAGATATSALVAVAELGARRVEVVARRPEAVATLSELGQQLHLEVEAVPLEAATHAPHALTLSTLPGGTALAEGVAEGLAASGGELFDVVYGRGTTPLVDAWERAGNGWTSGEGMLLHQAVLQIRIFATGDVDEPLPDEPQVVAVMRRALVGG